ncbi:hypothetical protein OGM63_18675 [Plectonema radiosum NIES-515]|uniref:Uncharacterized protein n=1 Tax=Plectonema radiosum NIES-515 TaxID=2986073 RepID=A0ABT3B3R0_9CYAN|nr:hypothetical protein [Plectonema radiosum]MCV3215514.1 hypothetical protein [Plectonema radiosum NIES-515]
MNKRKCTPPGFKKGTLYWEDLDEDWDSNQILSIISYPSAQSKGIPSRMSDRFYSEPTQVRSLWENPLLRPVNAKCGIIKFFDSITLRASS